jgi:hypothetical protein
MAPKQSTTTDRDEPTTIFAWERRRRGLDETQPISDEYPKLPATSPWAADPVGKEPAIDRSCDGNIYSEES